MIVVEEEDGGATFAGSNFVSVSVSVSVSVPNPGFVFVGSVFGSGSGSGFIKVVNDLS